MTIFNLGSLNVDRVFRVAHIAAPGETIASRSLAVFAGGKGANQSVALARAGAVTVHLGKIGTDGQWLLELLAREGVDTRAVKLGTQPTGQAMIQVDDTGQNAIVLLGGANLEIAPQDIDAALQSAEPGDWLLTQNETSSVPQAIASAKARGLQVAFNPAPYDERVGQYPLELVDLLCVNETEGAALTGEAAAEAIVSALTAQWPRAEVVLTLGAEGVLAAGPRGNLKLPACAVSAVDTTAAGDTLLGYYLARRSQGHALGDCLELASRAAALCVTRRGALDSIPRLAEVLAFSS